MTIFDPKERYYVSMCGATAFGTSHIYRYPSRTYLFIRQDIVPIDVRAGRFAREGTLLRLYYGNVFSSHELTWVDRDSGHDLYGYPFIHPDNNTAMCHARVLAILDLLCRNNEVILPSRDPMRDLQFEMRLLPEDHAAHYRDFKRLTDTVCGSAGCAF